MSECKKIYCVANKTFSVYFESRADAEDYMSKTTSTMGFTPIEYFASSIPDRKPAELCPKCGNYQIDNHRICPHCGVVDRPARATTKGTEKLDTLTL
jgi:ribosomal protein L32